MAPFCSCPASLVSRKFFAVGPGCAKCFFFCCAPSGAATFRRGQSKKKNTPPRVFFFFCSGPVPASNAASPSLAFRRGRSKKKKHPGWCFFFAAAPCGRSLTHCGPGWRCLPLAGAVFFFLLRPRPGRGGVFFLLWPRPDAHSLTVGCGDFGKARVVFFFFAAAPGRVFLENSKKCPGYYIGSKKDPAGPLLPLPFPGAGAKKKHPGWCFFFCSGPVPASNGASPSLAFRRGRSKKKHPGWFFFLLWPRAGFQRGFSFPCLSPGPQQKKKKTPWVVFFFCCGPARTLTHSLRAWVAMPPPRRGGVFFFAAAPPGPGWCFFFAVAPPGRSLTHGGLGRFRQGPGGAFFFLLRPRRVFLENSKKCLGYYIGSKKTRRGHSKIKNTTSLL